MIIRGFEDLKEKPIMENKPNIPWSHAVMMKVGVTCHTPSPLYIWYQEENAKRTKGERNEIDENEIIQAAKGVRNRWYERVTKNPNLYIPVLENKCCDWEAMKNG